MESSFRKSHMVGILPLSPARSDLGMPWPDYLFPVDHGLCILKNCIYECLQAGCDSIWVVCNDDTSPIVKKLIGDYVLAPDQYYDPSGANYNSSYERHIPIFYTPLSQKNRKISSIGWSALEGALTSFKVCSRISKWVRPSKYYVSFPYSMHDTGVLRQNRKIIKSRDLCFLSYADKTVENNLEIGFSFSPRHWVTFKRNVKQNCSGGARSLPLEERWSSSNFTLDKIFNCDMIEEVKNILEVTNYTHFDSWNSVRDFHRENVEAPLLEKKIIGPYFK